MKLFSIIPIHLFIYFVYFVHVAFSAVDIKQYWDKTCSLKRINELTVKSNLEVTCHRRPLELLSAGGAHTCALTTEGAYECIGDDDHGQSNKHEPKWPSKKGVKYIQVSAGSSHTCALTTEGAYECIGSNTNGRSNKHQPFVFDDECAVGSGRARRGAPCLPCGVTSVSKGGLLGKCHECLGGSKASPKKDRCVFPFIEEEIKRMKEEQNDLSIRNSRLWAKDQIRMRHDDEMAKRKTADNQAEKTSCEKEEDKGTVVFPAIDLPNEIEDIEDTTCIDTNRDELLKSFCSFRIDLDIYFKIHGIKRYAKSFFPNICCKERKDTTLEACEDTTRKIARNNIIPFALSQGGHYSRHNLYAEVTDALKKNGYLHKGMLSILKDAGLPNEIGKNKLVKRINGFFDELSLCGPRVIREPGTQGERQLCQLFVPYGHVLTHFYNEIVALYETNSFLQVVEGRLGKVSAAMAQRQSSKVGVAHACYFPIA